MSDLRTTGHALETALPDPAEADNVAYTPSMEQLREFSAEFETTTEFDSPAYVSDQRSRSAESTKNAVDDDFDATDYNCIETAIEYAKAHPDRMAAIERERKRTVRERRRRARERKQLALGRACPQCDGRLRTGEDLPLALVWCPSCGEVHVVKRLLSDTP